MGVGAELERREDRPAYVRFERRAVEDKAASLAAGHYVGRDVDYALVTPPYSKDVVVVKAKEWLESYRRDAAQGRLPKDWLDMYEQAYAKWKRGEEIPLNGTPVRGWGVISPAQQETLVRLNILTVEDLAGINDEGMRRIGMGSLELKTKAQTWIAQNRDKGPLTQEMAALKVENVNLRAEVETLKAQLTALLAGSEAPSMVTQEPQDISASDLIEEPAPIIRRGRPRKEAAA